MASLARIFNKDVSWMKERLAGQLIFNWLQQPTALGAYSYATTASAAVISYLNTPIDDTIYFAGEGLYDGLHPGTVEAAIVNSLAVIRKMN